MEIKSLQILAGGMRHTMQKSPDGEEVGVACRFVPWCLAGVCARGGISFLFSWWERASEGKEGGGKVTWDFFLLCLLCALNNSALAMIPLVWGKELVSHVN